MLLGVAFVFVSPVLVGFDARNLCSAAVQIICENILLTLTLGATTAAILSPCAQDSFPVH